MDQKIINIQAVRAAAALGVLVSHLYAYEARYSLAPVLPAEALYGFAGVDLFFAVSGFVMVLVSRGRRGPRAAGAFLFSRAWRIYPPYWLYTALAIAGVFAIGEAEARLAESPLLQSAALWPMTPQLPLLQIGWTLTHELYFYLVFALFMLAPRRALPFLLAVWAALLPLAWAAGLRDVSSVTRLVLSPLTFEFILGAVAGLLVLSGRRRFGWAALALGVIGLVLGSVWLGPAAVVTFEEPVRRALAWAIPCALIVYGAACVEIDGRRRAPAAAVALGDWSYSLYLLHFIVLAALARLWADAFTGVWDNIAFILVSLGICIALARVSFRRFERPVLAAGAHVRDRLFPPTRPKPLRRGEGPQPDGEPDEARIAGRMW